MTQKKRIVITGIGLVSCFGTDVDQFYQSLLEGKSGIRPIESFPVEDYPTQIAGTAQAFDVEGYMDKKQARRVDPCIRFTIYAGKRALEQSGLTEEAFDKLDLKKCGVLVGTGMGGMSTLYEGTETILTKGYKRLTPFFIPYIITNMGGALLAIETGFMGPNYSISTACATANYSIYTAAEHIRKGDADLMLCGGSESAIDPIGLSGFMAMKALSRRNDEPEKASRPWDKNRDGFVMGEGSAVFVLESLEHALERGAPILAEYLGGAISCDAYHMTAPEPNGEGVALSIGNALKDAGIEKERVNYINAHATATTVGDIAEAIAIKKAFKEHAGNIKINATKSMTGHCLGAAAAIEGVATLCAIQTGKIHPTINLDDPEDCLEGLDVVIGAAQDHQIDVALSNSFGFGGHNSSLLFAAYHP
ncbi:MAG: 3-oxoacyl-[acyl-carrier-protein] synthase 2 [Chlamydiae bacterium]|nr:3-oxoacyl-[acyl-carrier-protein] synthase 2 [Chlamydiota bacterium]